MQLAHNRRQHSYVTDFPIDVSQSSLSTSNNTIMIHYQRSTISKQLSYPVSPYRRSKADRRLGLSWVLSPVQRLDQVAKQRNDTVRVGSKHAFFCIVTDVRDDNAAIDVRGRYLSLACRMNLPTYTALRSVKVGTKLGLG